jgi:hypothetical protein
MTSILSSKAFRITTFISMMLLLSLYIFQVGNFTQQNYLQKDYEKQIEKLLKETETLEITFSKSDSLNNIENYLINENFVKSNPKYVKYIQILGSTVVTK